MKKKSMPYGVYHLLTCVLAVVMAVLVVLVSQRAEEKWYLKLDVSPSGVTNLSDYTLSRLHALDEDVLLYPVYTSGYDSTVRDLVTETLNKMSAECAHVRVETIDPVTQPQRIAALSGDAGSIENGTVFITNQDATRIIRLSPEEFLFSRTVLGEDYTTVPCWRCNCARTASRCIRGKSPALRPPRRTFCCCLLPAVT